MAAKTGGTRRAPAAAKKVAAGAAVSPADVQETLIPADTDLMKVEGTVDLLKAAGQAVDAGIAEARATEDAADTQGEPAETEALAAAVAAGRLAAIAALTGSPEQLAATPAVVVPEVEATGDEQTWADGDEPLVAGVVAFTVFQAIVAEQLQHAYKGETIHAPETVIARGERLGAVVRVEA